MLELLTTDAFAQWFGDLHDDMAEDVATAVDVIQSVGPTVAAPGSREALLWYEHPNVASFFPDDALAWDLEAWGAFRDYAKRVLAKLEAPRFERRLASLGAAQAAEVLGSIREIKKAADPRQRWALKLRGDPLRAAPLALAQNGCAEVRRMYLAALTAAGFEVEDLPAHSLALRELSRRAPDASFRLLYGVDASRDTALLVVGERLDRSFYGDTVRRAENVWKRYLGGTLDAVEPARLR